MKWINCIKLVITSLEDLKMFLKTITYARMKFQCLSFNNSKCLLLLSLSFNNKCINNLKNLNSKGLHQTFSQLV
jgi:hypothetical protein